MNDLDDIVAEFLVESHENLDQMDRDLVALEQEPTSKQLLGSVFRTVHTIKGTTGFLGFGRLQALAHAGESLLSRLRDGELGLTPEVTAALLQMVDATRALLSVIESTGGEGTDDYAALIAELVRLQASPATPPPAAPADLIGQVIVSQGAATADEVSLATTAQDVGDPRPIGQILVSHGSTTPTQVAEALHQQADQRSVVDRSIRVDVDLLDSLMRTVGELVLTRNQIVGRSAASGDTALVRASARLSSIVTELQDGVTKTRMQPIDNVWSKLPRLVRDLALTTGKAVRLDLHGRETELDKTILEAIRDPLTHLVRNAVDHGIELPAVRSAVGKDPQGVLTLRAYHEAGQVTVDISDDGAGMDPAAIAAAARHRGLVTDDELARMSEAQVRRLVFLPGLSTSGHVTTVSGRGVGMDVVKTNIEAVGGSVDVTSTRGEGTRFRVRIPLTLAIMDVLIVTCRGRRYAIPSVILVELIRLPDGSAVERVCGCPVVRRRGELLALFSLSEQLGLPPAGVDEPGTARTIVVLDLAGRQFGLLVDEVLDIEEIVVKPLGPQLRGLRVYAGATILGDGDVVLVLDVGALAAQAGIERAHPGDGDSPGPAPEPGAADDGPALLIASVGPGRRVGIPLAAVTRLERVSADAVERVGGNEVLHYRDRILPLIWLAELIEPGRARPARTALEVVVCSDGAASAGLVVETIDDVELRSSARTGVGGVGLTGSAVVRQRITALIDVGQAVRAASGPDRDPLPPARP